MCVLATALLRLYEGTFCSLDWPYEFGFELRFL